MSKKNRKPRNMHKNKYEEFSKAKDLFSRISLKYESDKKGYFSRNDRKEESSIEKKYYVYPRFYREESRIDFY